MRRQAAAFLALLVLGSVPALLAGRARAEDAPKPRTPVEKTFLIPAGEGYGVGECLSDGPSECGKVVADAWCESQGFASANSYGVASRDEYTGAIDATVRAGDRPIRITCQD